MLPTPHVMALSSALCAASATILIHRGLRGSTFYAGAWINVVVGAVAAWSAALLLVRFDTFPWQAVPYFALSGLIGTTGGRLFRVLAIQKVGAPVASAVNNMTPLVASGLAILLLGERVTLPIVGGTLVIVAGTDPPVAERALRGVPRPRSPVSVHRGLVLRHRSRSCASSAWPRRARSSAPPSTSPRP